MKRQIIILALFLTIALGLIPALLVHTWQTPTAYATAVDNRLQPPTLGNLFGTDALGRDHFARTMLATGLSLGAAGRAFLVAFVLALLLGSLAGLCKDRWPDRIISYVISIILTVPFILLAVALAAVLRADLNTIYLIVGGIAWAPPARIVRSEVARMRDARFVISGKAFGIPPMAIFFHSILPVVILPPFISLLYLLPELVGLDVGLSFFGLGAQPPIPTLGRLIFDGMNYLRSAWWLALLPAIVLVVFFLLLYMVMQRTIQSSERGANS